MVNINQLKDIANVLRRDVLKITTEAGSGHPTSCLSCAEIISVLFFNEMKYKTKDPDFENNDEFILSKGHAAPILYSTLYRSGCINRLNGLRQIGSSLQGHPVPSEELKWIKVATGSLGQGLSIGIGYAIAAKKRKLDYRTYVLIGDSEFAEGSIYEALQIASHYDLNNLCAIIDVNRLGQSGETMLGYNLQVYEERIKSFGWNTIIVNGHEINELITAFEIARKETRRPTAIIAKTVKGKGVSFLENKEGWHGKSLNQDELEKAFNEIPEVNMPKIVLQTREATDNIVLVNDNKLNFIKTDYKIGELVAAREAYGKALVKLAEINENIVALDAEVSNSTYSHELFKKFPDKYIECYIAEQNMISVASGLSIKGFNVFASTFACFLSRAHDQIRMATISNSNITIVGSHAGVSIGEDGPSQMGLEDISMFRCLPNSIVFYPSDAVSTEKIVELCNKIKGLKYIRTTRPKTPVIYSDNEKFEIGGLKVLRQSKKDKVVIVGAGITLHEAIKSYERLAKNGIMTCVVDCYCVKPFNSKKFIELAMKHGKKILVVEDHYQEGGIGETIAKTVSGSAISVACLAINELPRSGKSEELMKKYKIDSNAIVNAVKSL